MNADEIVRVLRSCGGGPEGMKITRDAADLIETLQAELVHVSQLNATVNSMYQHAEASRKTLEQALLKSQCREKAAVEEIDNFTKERMQQLTLEESLILQPVLNRIYTIRKRGPQETGEES